LYVFNYTVIRNDPIIYRGSHIIDVLIHSALHQAFSSFMFIDEVITVPLIKWHINPY